MLRAEIKELLKEVKDNLSLRYGHERVLDILQQENTRLREENRRLTLDNNKLLDRLMSRNFESYATYREDDEISVGPFSIGSNNEPLKDESNIGEVIEE